MLSIQHMIIIFVVALVVFGPEKLPDLARTLGKAMAEFRRITGDLRSSFDEQLRELERETAIIEAKKRHLEAEQKALAQKTASSLEPATEKENSIGGETGKALEADAVPSELEAKPEPTAVVEGKERSSFDVASPAVGEPRRDA
jgi:sec-independent protein translocase protein TatB